MTMTSLKLTQFNSKKMFAKATSLSLFDVSEYPTWLKEVSNLMMGKIFLLSQPRLVQHRDRVPG